MTAGTADPVEDGPAAEPAGTADPVALDIVAAGDMMEAVTAQAALAAALETNAAQTA